MDNEKYLLPPGWTWSDTYSAIAYNDENGKNGEQIKITTDLMGNEYVSISDCDHFVTLPFEFIKKFLDGDSKASISEDRKIALIEDNIVQVSWEFNLISVIPRSGRFFGRSFTFHVKALQAVINVYQYNKDPRHDEHL